MTGTTSSRVHMGIEFKPFLCDVSLPPSFNCACNSYTIHLASLVFYIGIFINV